MSTTITYYLIDVKWLLLQLLLLLHHWLISHTPAVPQLVLFARNFHGHRWCDLAGAIAKPFARSMHGDIYHSWASSYSQKGLTPVSWIHEHICKGCDCVINPGQTKKLTREFRTLSRRWQKIHWQRPHGFRVRFHLALSPRLWQHLQPVPPNAASTGMISPANTEELTSQLRRRTCRDILHPSHAKLLHIHPMTSQSAVQNQSNFVTYQSSIYVVVRNDYAKSLMSLSKVPKVSSGNFCILLGIGITMSFLMTSGDTGAASNQEVAKKVNVTGRVLDSKRNEIQRCTKLANRSWKWT